MDLSNLAAKNLSSLKANSYPGRGIILGTAADGQHLVQVYWIMGRSENSRNRVFLMEDNGFVRTAAHDPSKLVDPSLIIYYPAKTLDRCHIVTNGDQTDTISEFLQSGKDFDHALQMREYEPDAPNFTPRISGIMDMMETRSVYKLSILKTAGNDPSLGCQRFTYNYEKALPGYGHFISTYAGDGNPLPSFAGEPQVMALPATPEACLEHFWDALDRDNRVSIFVKWIDRLTFSSQTIVKNRHA